MWQVDTLSSNLRSNNIFGRQPHDILASYAIPYPDRQRPSPQPDGHAGYFLITARQRPERPSSYSNRLVSISGVCVASLVAIYGLPTVTTSGRRSPHH